MDNYNGDFSKAFKQKTMPILCNLFQIIEI